MKSSLILCDFSEQTARPGGHEGRKDKKMNKSIEFSEEEIVMLRSLLVDNLRGLMERRIDVVAPEAYDKWAKLLEKVTYEP